MLIGVISDTHGLLRPRVFEVFEGVDRILHAGDIGRDDSLLIDLRALAPVEAVHGNTDGFPLCQRLPKSRSLQFHETRVFLTHICVPDRLRLDWPSLGPVDVVIFGHSHKPILQRQHGILFFNPGSAGPRRFSLPVTVGLLRIDGERVEGEIIHLED